MSLFGKAVWPCLVLGALCVVAHLAWADGEVRVVIVGPSEQDATVSRIRLELLILGVVVEFARSSGSADLSAIGREHHASAVAYVEQSPPGVRIWTDPTRHPSPTLSTELRVDPVAPGTTEPGLLALRAVELLRGRLLPVPETTDAGRSPQSIDAGAPAAAFDAGRAPEPPPVASTPEGPSIFVGPAVLLGPGRLDPTAQVFFGGRWAPFERADLDVMGLIPTLPASVSATDGQMVVRIGAALAGMSLKLTEPSSPVFATVGLGGGVLFAFYRGEGSPGFTGKTGNRFMALPYARLSGGYWLGRLVALRADLLSGVALPEPVLRIADRNVAEFGQPAFVMSVGLEARP